MSENKMPTGFERGDLFAPRSALIDSKDEVEQAYVLLLQAKTQIEADEQEIDALEAKHVESVAAWKTEIEKLRGDEAQQRLRAELAERLVENMGIQCASDLHNARHEILELKQRNMILEQGKQRRNHRTLVRALRLTREIEAERDTLKAQADKLAAALEIYATPDNWRQKDTRTGAFDWFLRGNAGWDIAQAALAAWRKGE